MNAIKSDGSKKEEKRKMLHDWLTRFTSDHKKVFSSSAHYTDYLQHLTKQTTTSVLRVYGGLTRVSYLKTYVIMRLLT
jgi:hypothetical protein